MVAKSFTFKESLDYLLSLGNEVSAMKLGLENIRRLLAELGDPQNDYLKVQVAGTNGKGSVCAFLDSICREADIRAGLYTSPHLISITERIKIAGVDISESDFARLASRVRNTAEELVREGTLEYTPTYFEQVTAIGLLAFAEAKVELAILETGLGGRLDATTAANAEIAAITRIDYDHQKYLGETIEEIAAEKAAIITVDTQATILGDQSRDIMRFLRKHSSDLGIEPINDEYEPWRVLSDEDGTVKVILSLSFFPGTRLGLKGRHQIENAQTAIQIAKALLYDGLFPSMDDIEVKVVEGLKNARHPGRLDWREYKGHRVLLDGAHNAGGAKALADYITTDQSDARITLVFGLMDDKDVDAFTSVLFPFMENIVFTRPNSPRAADPTLLAERARATIDPAKISVVPDVADALDAAVRITTGYGAARPAFTCVAGSLYLVGEALGLIQVIHR